MSPIALACIAFACISGGALIGIFLRNTLSGHHLSTDAKDVVRLGTGLIGTIAAQEFVRHAEHSNQTDDGQYYPARPFAGAVRVGDRRSPQSVAARRRYFSRPNVA